MIGSIVIDDNPVATKQDTYRKTLYPGDWLRGSYSQEIRAMGGYWACSFEMRGARQKLEDFFLTGLSRRVRSYAPNGLKAWEGYINSMRLKIPGATYEITLDTMANKVWMRYNASSPALLSGTTVQVHDPSNLARMESNATGAGGATRSNEFEDTDSQAQYGEKQMVLSGGEYTSTYADLTAAAYLALVSDPTRGNLKTELVENRGVSLEIECNGYFRTLGWKVYNSTGAMADFADVDTLLPGAITANADFITAVNAPDNNDLEVGQNVDVDNTLENVVLDWTRVGDENGDRFVIGVYDDRELTWKKAADKTTDNIKYRMRSRGDFQLVRESNGRKVNPVELRPDKWIRVENLLSRRQRSANDLYQDLTVSYIEAVRYTEPDQLTIVGNRGAQIETIMTWLTYNGLSLN